MTQQEYEQKISRIEKLVEEDHDMILSMHRTQRLSTMIRIVYWLLLIGGFLGAYYWVFPYMDTAKDWYSKFTGQIKETQKSIKETQKTLEDLNQKKNTIQDKAKSLYDDIEGIKNSLPSR